MPKEDVEKARKSLLQYQTEYLVKELYNKSVVSNQKELVNALKGDNPAIATEYFTKYFERPANADAEAEKRKTNIDKFQNDIKVIVLVVVDTTFLYNIKDFYRYSMYSFKYFKRSNQ